MLRSTRSQKRSLALFGPEEREVVVERFSLDEIAEEERAQFVARATALAGVTSPNLPTILDLAIGPSDITVVCASRRGEWLDDLAAAEALQKSHFLALSVELRILLDVIAGLSAMHAYRGPGAPVIHGAVAPCHVFVAVDGTASLAGALRVPGTRAGGALGYLAPEIMLGDGTADARADIYSVSVILWEVLSGKRLFEQRTENETLSRQLAGPLPRATVREAWAEPLADVAARGLAVDPTLRFESVNDIAAEVRSIAQARLAAPTRVGRTVESLAEARLALRKFVPPGVSSDPVMDVSSLAPPTPSSSGDLVAASTRPPSEPAASATDGSGARRIVSDETPTPYAPFAPFAAVDVPVDADDLEVAPSDPPAPMVASRRDPPPTAFMMSPAPTYDETPQVPRTRSPKDKRARLLAFLFLIASASTFAAVSWAVLRRAGSDTSSERPPTAASRVLPAPSPATSPASATARRALTGAVASTPSAAVPVPVPVPVPGAPAAAAPKGATPSVDAAPGPTRKVDRPRKPKPAAYEPEGI